MQSGQYRTGAVPHHHTPSINSRALAVMSCFLMLYGAKCWVVAGYGSDTPFGDQWRAEADLLFRPYLGGSLRVSDLFAHHNEHRILLTRLISLGELWANGTWSPVLQMLVNALVHVTAVAALVVAVSRLLSTGALIAFVLFATVVAALPFGWENTLGGFQLQFYLLILLALSSLFVLYDARAWSPRWFVGVLIGVMSYFAMASGALTLAAAAALTLVQLIAARRTGVREWAGLAGLAVVALVMILDVPAPVAAGAGSIEQAFAAAVKGASWPLAAHHWSTGAETIGAVLVQAPLIVMAVRLLRQRPDMSDRRWLLLGLGLWIALQLVAIAHSRGAAVTAPRYLDLIVFGLLVNGACAFVLAQESQRSREFLAIGALGCWLIAVLYGGGQKALSFLPAQLAEYAAAEQIRTDNLKAYLATGDFAHLRDKPPFHTPSAGPDHVAAMVSDPALRAVLPPSLFGRVEATPLRDAVLKIGPMLTPIGLALLALALAAFGRRREQDAPIT
jgi:hypothetical protein